MSLLRWLILAVAIALGTVLVGWWVVPILAAGYGLLVRDTARPGLTAATAATAAMVGWGGYLQIVSFGGGPVMGFARDLAHAMNLPAWGPHVATLGFPALLAGSAAFLAATLVRRADTKRR